MLFSGFNAGILLNDFYFRFKNIINKLVNSLDWKPFMKHPPLDELISGEEYLVVQVVPSEDQSRDLLSFVVQTCIQGSLTYCVERVSTSIDDSPCAVGRVDFYSVFFTRCLRDYLH